LDFVAAVCSTLNDEEMNNTNNLMEGMDPTTRRPIILEKNMTMILIQSSETRFLDFIYRIEMDLYCPLPGNCDPTKKSTHFHSFPTWTNPIVIFIAICVLNQ
jgi:hypothetical protein